MQAATEVVVVHGLSLPTVVAAGTAASGEHELSRAVGGVLQTWSKERRQFCIIEPQFDPKGWKHKNVGKYPTQLPEDMLGSMPPQSFAGTIVQLNERTAALQKQLHHIVAMRLMMQLASIACCIPAILNAERLLSGELWAAEDDSSANSSTTVTGAPLAASNGLANASSWDAGHGPEPEPEPEPEACGEACHGKVQAIAPPGPSVLEEYGLPIAAASCVLGVICFIGSSIRSRRCVRHSTRAPLHPPLC